MGSPNGCLSTATPQFDAASTHGGPLTVPVILCVDGEPDVLVSLRWVLTREGFDVVTALDGEEALMCAQERTPDLIITDFTMTDMPGLELCSHLRSHRKTAHIPIILYTALTPPATPHLYESLCRKPGDLNGLASNIWTLLAVPD